MTAKPINQLNNVFSSLFNTQPNKSKLRKQAKKSTKKIPKNIYNNKTIGESLCKYDFIHYFFKTWFVEPGIKLVAKVLGKFRSRSVPDEPWNKNLKIFDLATEKAIRLWCSEYMVCKEKPGTRYSEEKVESDALNGKPQQMIRVCKELLLSIGLNDTAYREFLNIFVFELANEVIRQYSPSDEDKLFVHKQLINVYGHVSQEEYESLRNKLFKVDVKHLFYTSHDIVCPTYFALFPVLSKPKFGTAVVNKDFFGGKKE